MILKAEPYISSAGLPTHLDCHTVVIVFDCAQSTTYGSLGVATNV